MKISELTKKYLKENNISRNCFARKIGISTKTIKRFLDEENYKLSERNLIKLKGFLGGDWVVSADDILKREEGANDDAIFFDS